VARVVAGARAAEAELAPAVVQGLVPQRAQVPQVVRVRLREARLAEGLVRAREAVRLPEPAPAAEIARGVG
jgi:hypothetical protein